MNITALKQQINDEASRAIAAIKNTQRKKLAALAVLGGGPVSKSVSVMVREAIPTITGAYTARSVAEKIKSDTGVSIPVSQVSSTLAVMYNKGEVYRAQKGVKGKTPHVYQRPVEPELL